jgi:nitrile hydratase
MAKQPHDHHHDHRHSHDHGDHGPHDPIEVHDGAGAYELMVHAVKELMIEKGLLTADQLRRMLEIMDSRTPAIGAKIVARAWTEPEFRRQLVADATTTLRALGHGMDGIELVAVENTPDVHNVIVCTLCSCYLRTLLGSPPDWYKSRNYRARVVREPRAVLREFGTVIPDNVTIRVHDSNADLRCLVLPMRPAGTEGWSQDQLAAIVTRDCMIGVTLPKPDVKAAV